MSQLPNWMIQLQLDNSNFLRGLAASTQATRDFNQALAMVGMNGMNALMGVYQMGPMLQGMFEKLKGTIQGSIGAYAEYEAVLTSVDFLAGNMGTTMGEVNQAVKQLTTDGLMTATASMEALKSSFTLGIPVQNAVASIELLKNSLMAAGKDPNLVKNVIDSIRTMNSQRLDEYGITKNLDQLLKEETKTLQKLLTDKKALASADAQYKTLIDTLPESYRKAATSGKNAIGSLKETIDETTRNTLMLIGVTREAATNYTSFAKFKKDRADNPKDSLQAEVEKDFTSRFLTMIENTKGARKQGAAAFREAFLSEENIGVYAARTEKMNEIFRKSIQRGIIEKGKEQSLTQMGLGGLDSRDPKERGEALEQRKKGAAQLLIQAEAFDAMLEKYNEKERKAGRQVITIADLKTRSLEEQKKLFTEIGASFDNSFYMIFSGAKTAAAQNLQTSFSQMSALLNEFTVKLGEVFSKPVKSIIESDLRPLLTGLSQLDAHTVKNIATLLALGTAFTGLAAAVTTFMVSWRMMGAGLQMVGTLLDDNLAKAMAGAAKLPGIAGGLTTAAATITQRVAQGMAERGYDRGRAEIEEAARRRNLELALAHNEGRLSTNDYYTRSQTVETQRVEAHENLQTMHQEKMRSLSGSVQTPQGMTGVLKTLVDDVGGSVQRLGNAMLTVNSMNVFERMREGASTVAAVMRLTTAETINYTRAATAAALQNPLAALSGAAVAGAVRGLGLITAAIGGVIKGLVNIGKTMASLTYYLLPLIVLGEVLTKTYQGVKGAIEEHNKLKGADGKESKELTELRQKAAGETKVPLAPTSEKDVSQAKDQLETYNRMEAALKKLDHALAVIRGSFASLADVLTGSHDGLNRMGTIAVEVAAWLTDILARAIDWLARMTAGAVGSMKAMWQGLVTALSPLKGLFTSLGQGISNIFSWTMNAARPLGNFIVWLGTQISNLLNKIPLLGTVTTLLSPGLTLGAHAIKGFQEGTAAYDKVHGDNVKKEERAKKAETAPKPNVYSGKPARSPADDSLGKKSGGNKDPYADALALLKLQEQLDILRATSDQDIVAAKERFKKGVESLVRRFKPKDQKQALDMKKEVEEATNSLTAAQAMALEHNIQLQEKHIDNLRITGRLYRELTLAASQYRAALIGDKAAEEKAQSRFTVQEAGADAQQKQEMVGIAERKVTLAQLRVAERGGSVGTNLNALAAAQEELKKARIEAEVAKSKYEEITLREERKQSIIDADKRISSQKYDLELLEPKKGLTGTFTGTALKDFRQASEETISALNKKFQADPSSGDPQKTLEQFRQYREILKQLASEELNSVIANSKTLKEGVDDLTTAHNKAQAAVASFSSELKDVQATEKTLTEERERLTRSLLGARTDSARDSFTKELVANAKQLNAAHQQRVLLQAKLATGAEAELLTKKDLLRVQQQLNDATMEYYTTTAEASAQRVEDYGQRGAFTNAREEYQTLVKAQEGRLKVAQEGLRLAQKSEDKERERKAFQALKQVEAELLVTRMKSSQSTGSTQGARELFDRMQANQKQLDTPGFLEAQPDQAAAIARQQRMFSEAYKRFIEETLASPIILYARVLGHWEQFSEQAGQAIGGAFKEAFMSNDWSNIGQDISQRMRVAFKEAVGNSIQTIVGQPIENMFKKITSSLQDWGQSFIKSLGEQGPEIAKQIQMGFEAIQAAFAIFSILQATAQGTGGKGEQAIKEGDEIYDQTEEVRGVIVGETSIGIGKLRELFDPVAIAMQAAAQAMTDAANAIRNAQAMGATVLPAVGGTGVGGSSVNASNIITVNLNATGIVTVVADIPSMQKQINTAIQETVANEVKRAIVNQMTR